MYIPSTLIVMVSWVSFWVGRSSVPARAALGITTVLTLLTLISSTNANMPKISYMKAIDVYFASCFLFVLASLIEFATVCYLDKPRSAPRIKRSSMKNRVSFIIDFTSWARLEVDAGHGYTKKGTLRFLVRKIFYTVPKMENVKKVSHYYSGKFFDALLTEIFFARLNDKLSCRKNEKDFFSLELRL